MVSAETFHPYPAEYEEWVVLKDGSRVFLRPIRPTDGPLILDLFQRLSPETIYFRFLTHLDRLRPEMLRNLVEIDYVTHFGLAAVAKPGDEETIVGTSRYIATEGTDRAELTVTLRDDWQRKGLGSVMAARVVAAARAKGIAVMEIAFDYRNEGMKRVFASLGYPVKYESSVVDIADRMEIHIGDINL
jgi:acetyltransferase